MRLSADGVSEFFCFNVTLNSKFVTVVFWVFSHLVLEI